MKEIIAQYSTAVIASLVGGFLFWMIFHLPFEGRTGIAQIVGMVTEQQTGTSLSDDYEKNEEQYRVPAKLELTYKNENPITAGEKTKVWEHFYMDGADASKTSAKICAIFDEEGNRYSVITENGQDYIYIERAGIYQVYFRIIDEFYRIQYAVASIPVQVKKE